MSPDRWERIKQLFDEALHLDCASRPAFLAESCRDDDALRTQVESLLDEYEQADTSFLRTSSLLGEAPSSPPPTPADPAVNGRYRIERELGRGGSGVVYLARDEQLHDRPVVLKFLNERSEQHPALRARFRHEMEALARVSHPGVVNVFDVGDLPGGRRYIVMEFIDGVTLRALLGTRGLDLPRAARLVRQICSALSAVHAKGIYHRDLKPENIMIVDAGGPSETVKLIDFGIAKVDHSQVQAHTETWTFVGTINYVAPEQLLGTAGAAADIWALGVIAYEMTTGRRPFQPHTPFHLYELQRSHKPPHPSLLRLGLPRAAGSSVLRALSFLPNDRQNTPAEFADEFSGPIDANAGSVGAWFRLCAAAKRHPRTTWGLALACLLVAAGAWRSFEISAVPRTRPSAESAIPALELSINTPLGVAVDRRGNVYFSEYANNRVWKVDPAGMATAVAGTGVAGFTGNGGPAVLANIQSPRLLAAGEDRYLYIVETTTDRVRRVDLATGIITHVLGIGRPRFNGDGNVGTATSFSEGLGLAVDRQGDLIFADTNNFRIRRLAASDGRVSTIAGNGERGFSGDGGEATDGPLDRIGGLALHPNGDIFFFEIENQRIRRIRNGILTTIAGNKASAEMEGPALTVRLGSSTGMAIDPTGTDLYFTEESFDTLRKLNLASGRISVVAGTGTSGYSGDGGPAQQAEMANPTGVAVDLLGNIYVAEAISNRIRRISAKGVISTFAGGKVPYSRRNGSGILELASRTMPTWESH